MESYAIASFRSRQAVFRFESVLRQRGVSARIISTPRAVSLGCGLSLRFERADLPKAMAAYRQEPIPNLIGFYTVEGANGNLRVNPVAL